MSNIIKTKALVLNKLDFGDTSKIANFYTEDHGKISAIIKGARSPKSKIGSVIDVLNLVQIVYYSKSNRDMQLITQSELINHFPKIKEDLEKLKYASAISELVLKLLGTDESHPKLFRGIIRILELMNLGEQPPDILFLKFFLFFLKETGYEIQLENCSNCDENLKESNSLTFNFYTGFYCQKCSKEHVVSYEFNEELFNLLVCLSRRKNDCSYKQKDINKLIFFLEKYISYQIPEFKGLNSLQVY